MFYVAENLIFLEMNSKNKISVCNICWREFIQTFLKVPGETTCGRHWGWRYGDALHPAQCHSTVTQMLRRLWSSLSKEGPLYAKHSNIEMLFSWEIGQTLTLQSLLFRFPCFFRFVISLAYLCVFPLSSKEFRGPPRESPHVFFAVSPIFSPSWLTHGKRPFQKTTSNNTKVF